MHERQAALIGAILALTLLATTPARAERDAATKAREGDINHWIEYYRNGREPGAVPPARPQNGAAAEEERGKGERGKVKVRRRAKTGIGCSN